MSFSVLINKTSGNSVQIYLLRSGRSEPDETSWGTENRVFCLIHLGRTTNRVGNTIRDQLPLFNPRRR